MVLAPTVYGKRRLFEAVETSLDNPEAWLLRRGRGMVPVRDLAPRHIHAAMVHGITGWRRHWCPLAGMARIGDI